MYGNFVRYQKRNKPRALTPDKWRGVPDHQRDFYIQKWRDLYPVYGDPPVLKPPSPPPVLAPVIAEDVPPVMPIASAGAPQSHRVKSDASPVPFSVMVARSVSKDEVKRTPAAQAALQKEWDRLRAAGCWDESRVREWNDVASEARREGTIAHMGRIFALCVEKGSELPAGDPGRKFKGRVVFQGNNVRDQNWDAAMFQDPNVHAGPKGCGRVRLICRTLSGAGRCSASLYPG